MGWQEELRAKRAETERWIRQREADLRRAAGQAEARGRQVYADAIKTGQQVLARTPAEVRALGIAAAQGRLPQALGEQVVKNVVRPTAAARPASKPAVREAPARPKPTAGPATAPSREKTIEGQLRAGLSGAVDEFSFGLADRGLAASEAVVEGGLQGFGERYDENMAVKRAEDARDARDYGTERNVGKAIGLVAGLAATGPTGAVVKTGLRGIPRVAKLMNHAAKASRSKLMRAGVDPRGLTTAAVSGGALTGIAGQGVADLASGKASSVQDYVGAAIGGGLAGATALRGGGPIASKAVLGGAMGAGATSLAQDALNRRPVSVDNAIESAHVGGVSGGVLDGLATHAVAAAPSRVKGFVGERMSDFKTLARGRIPHGQKPVPLRGGGASIPDQKQTHEFLWWGELDAPEYLESKMGPSARLSRAQRRLRAENPDRFMIDAWRFRDVGRAASLMGGPAGSQLTDEERFPWRVR